MIIDERAPRRAGKNVGRLSDRLDQTVVNEHGSFFYERISAGAVGGRIVGERQDAATNDAGTTSSRISFRTISSLPTWIVTRRAFGSMPTNCAAAR